MPFRLTTITLQKISKINAPDLLKAGKLAKLTEVGRLFHALMTLLAKKFILTVQSLRGLYSLYACPLVPVNCKNSKKISHVQSDGSKYNFITVREVQVQSPEFKTRDPEFS